VNSYVIVKVGDNIAELIPRHGDYEEWIAQALPGVVVVVDPRRGEMLPPPETVRGAIVTGSHAMVTERARWSEHTGEWLAQLVERSVPLLGICYGHQLLAHALGGEVGFHPGGIEIGTVAVRATAAAATDPLFGRLPARFPAQTIHSQTVLRLPQHALRLAGNEFEPHHAFRVGRCAWGVQFHPEFSAAVMRDFIEHLAPDLRRQNREPDVLAAAVTQTPAAASVLRLFAEIADR